MGAVDRIRFFLASIFMRRRIEREQSEELDFHLDMQAQKYVGQGLDLVEAHRRARVDLGSSALAVREATHDQRGTLWLDEVRRDLSWATRQLRNNPAFSLAAVLTLALGIGATTAILSVLNAVQLRPPPLAQWDRLVMVWETDRRSGTTREPGAWPDYVDFQQRSRSLDAIAAFTGRDITVTPDGVEPVRHVAVAATHNYFEVAGLTPLLGRFFTVEEDRPGGARVALISESMWREQFDGAPDVLSRQLRIDDELHYVIGVVPDEADFGLDQIKAAAAYHGPWTVEGHARLWLPLQAGEDEYPRTTHPFLLLGRLAANSEYRRANEELTAIAADLERIHPDANAERGVFIEPLSAVVLAGSRPTLWLLLGIATLVLVVACVNVANLLLARGAARARELAIRRALGASAGRLSRQLVVESLTLSIIGGVAGLFVAAGGLRLILALAPADIPRIAEAAGGLDLRIAAASLLISLLVGLLFGSLPVVPASGADPGEVMRREGRSTAGTGRRTMRNFLVVSEVALAVSLVITAGLLLRSFNSVLGVDPGFSAAGVYKAHYDLPSSRYPADFSRWPNWTEQQRAVEEMVARSSSIPGVTAASISRHHPLDAGFANSWLVVGREVEARDWPEIAVRFTTPGYLQTMQLPLAMGRELNESDDASAPPVVLINQATVDRWFADQEPIGRELRFWGVNRRIVGVVANERIRGLTEDAPPIVYAPLAQNPANSGVLLVRSSAPPAAVLGGLSRAIRSVDPGLAVHGVEPLKSTILASVSERRFALRLAAAFALSTLLLALIGVHGLVRYLASQRTREMGIRMALGATASSVVALVLRGTLGLAASGIAIGLILAAGVSRVVSGFLFGISAVDVATYAAASGVVGLAAFGAAIGPALRAARAAPLAATRSD
ncbi:MAG: ADOP family duplicated permease [Gemmatimonadota bacterium]